jgi:hypothetical protein
MKIIGFFFLSALFLVIFSILLAALPDISSAKSIYERRLTAQEVERIKKFEDSVKRDGDTLLLRSVSGSFIPLKDNPDCEATEKCVQYRFVDYFKDAGFFLVRGYYREKIEHIMISVDDGKKYFIHQLPRFSPDKLRFVTITNSLDKGYEVTGVYIWLIDGTRIVQEFSFETKDYASYHFSNWKTSKVIELRKWIMPSGGPCPEGVFWEVDIDLKMEAGGWKIYEDLTTASPKCIDLWYENMKK